MHYDIVALPKDQWKGTTIPLTTRSDSYYDLELSPLNCEGCTITIVRKPVEKEIVHTPEEYNFPDSLYQDHWEGQKPMVLWVMPVTFWLVLKYVLKSGRTDSWLQNYG